MDGSQSLKTLLKRGALLTAANWPIVLTQFVAESVLKMLVGVPIVGGAVLLVLVVGQELPDTAGSLREVAFGVGEALLEHPAGLAGFLASLAIAVCGGSVLTFVIKAGSVAVLVEAERRAGPIERPPLRWSALQASRAWSADRFLDGCARLWWRYCKLGFLLMVLYALVGGAYLALVIGGFSLAPVEPQAWWPALMTGAASSVGIVVISLANLVYLLLQMAMAADDVGLRGAAARVADYLRREGRWVVSVFLAVLTLVVVGMVASIIAAAGLGLVSFVPFLGLAVFPLQAMAWLLRGLLFQFIGFSALGSYLTLYRRAS